MKPTAIARPSKTYPPITVSESVLGRTLRVSSLSSEQTVFTASLLRVLASIRLINHGSGPDVSLADVARSCLSYSRWHVIRGMFLCLRPTGYSRASALLRQHRSIHRLAICLNHLAAGKRSDTTEASSPYVRVSTSLLLPLLTNWIASVRAA